MKKNKTLRIALVLCVLAIFCAALVGSTFAKYVTSDNSDDSARVSKWGVVISAATHNTDSNFETNYTVDDTTYSNAASLAVNASTADTNMVAPGTKDAQGITFTISGTPEVASKMTIDMTINSDVFLGKPAEGGNAAVNYGASNNGAYYPVKFTLVQTTGHISGAPVTLVDGGNLQDIQNVLNTYNDDYDTSYYPPNTKLDSTYVLTWEWAFESDSSDPNVVKDINTKDTILGDLADYQVSGFATDARSENIPAEYTDATKGIASGNWCVDINYTITFTIVQVN